jgi:hypothetical protein
MRWSREIETCLDRYQRALIRAPERKDSQMQYIRPSPQKKKQLVHSYITQPFRKPPSRYNTTIQKTTFSLWCNIFVRPPRKKTTGTQLHNTTIQKTTFSLW